MLYQLCAINPLPFTGQCMSHTGRVLDSDVISSS